MNSDHEIKLTARLVSHAKRIKLVRKLVFFTLIFSFFSYRGCETPVFPLESIGTQYLAYEKYM